MWVKNLFRIERGEIAWVAWLSAAIFFLSVGSVMLGSLLQALVIKRAGVQFLPYLHIFTAVISIFGAWLTLTVLRKWRALSQSTLFAFAGVGGAFLLALTQGVITNESGVVTVLAFVAFGILVATLSISNAASKLGVAVSDIFNYEQMQRLEPLIASVATLSVLVGGLVLAGLSERISSTALYMMVAFIFALTVPCYLVLQRMARKASLHVSIAVPEKLKKSWLSSFSLKSFIPNPHLRKFVFLLGVITGLSVIFSRIFGYSFSIMASVAFPSESELNAFFGTFTVVSSIGALIFINFIQHLLFKKYGLTNNLYTPPVVVMIGALAMFLYPIFWVVIVVVYIRDIIVDIQNTAYGAMMEGVSDYQRNQAWSWIDGPVYSLFDFVGSGILIGVGALFLPIGVGVAIRILALLALLFLLIRFLLTVRFKRLYPKILLASLKEGDFKTRLRSLEAMAEMRYMHDRHLGEVLDIIRDEEEPTVIRTTALKSIGKIQDPSALRVVSRFITHEDSAIRKQAIRTIAAFTYDPEKLYESGFSRFALIRALRVSFPAEKDPEIVNAILDALIALRDPDIIPFLILALESPSGEIRHSVLHSLRHFHDPAIIDFVKPLLDDKEAHVRAQAIVAMWQFPWERTAYLQAAVKELLGKPKDGEEFKHGAYLVGALRLRRYRKTIIEALESSRDDVKVAAAISLLKLGDESGTHILKEVMRSGTKELAYEVERLADHKGVPKRQQRLIEAYFHEYHLHYPPDLPVSEPLRIRLIDIPHGCLEGLQAYYKGREGATDLKKIRRALKKEVFPETKGRVVLAGLPDPWREMAAISLLANGYLVREAPVTEDFDDTAIVVADIDSDKFPRKTIRLVEDAAALQEGQVAKSHYAPSELLTEIRKLT